MTRYRYRPFRCRKRWSISWRISPFHHFLAFNSDIDWSSHRQVEGVYQRLNVELGLPVAGSFYLCAATPEWVSASDARGAPRQSVREHPTDGVPTWFHGGAMDTLHAWLDTIDVVELTRVDGADAADAPSFRWLAAAGPPGVLRMTPINQTIPSSK